MRHSYIVFLIHSRYDLPCLLLFSCREHAANLISTVSNVLLTTVAYQLSMSFIFTVSFRYLFIVNRVSTWCPHDILNASTCHLFLLPVSSVIRSLPYPSCVFWLQNFTDNVNVISSCHHCILSFIVLRTWRMSHVASLHCFNIVQGSQYSNFQL